MSKTIDLHLPKVEPVVRANGDAVVEMRQGGELVGELNFTKMVTNWLDAAGLIKKPRHLQAVR